MATEKGIELLKLKIFWANGISVRYFLFGTFLVQWSDRLSGSILTTEHCGILHNH
jgi:hypothetical protein